MAEQPSVRRRGPRSTGGAGCCCRSVTSTPSSTRRSWGLVGGHLDPGEEFEPAAYRELAEETEVVVPPGGLTLLAEFDVDHTEAYGTIDRMAVYVAADRPHRRRRRLPRGPADRVRRPRGGRRPAR